MLDAGRLAGRIHDLGMSQTELARRVGLSQQAVGKLVHGKSRETPKLHQIAHELKTTPGYLLGKGDNPDDGADLGQRLSSDEQEWVDMYAGLTPEQRKAIRLLVRDLIGNVPAGSLINDKPQIDGTQGYGRYSDTGDA